MNCQITDAGIAALNAGTGPIKLTSYKLGDAIGYIPSPTDTDIRGEEVYAGVPSEPLPENANLIRYSMYLDYPLGPFAFGEFGLFMQDGTLFALGCGDVLVQKLQLTSASPGNSIRVDVYLSMVGNNYAMWLALAESNNMFRLAIIDSPDVLPQSHNAIPNAYVVKGASSVQSAVIAYTDRTGLWCFDAYAYANTIGGTVVSATPTAITVALSDYNAELDPLYLGQLIMQFSTGELFSICRYITNVSLTGNVAVFALSSPLGMLPIPGDKYIIYSRQGLSVSNIVLTPATATELGGIKVGNTLQITPDGILDINPTSGQLVTSVNGMSGAVTVDASNILGFATVAYTGEYSDLRNPPSAYALPPASMTVRGGIRLPTSGNLVIVGTDRLDLSFTPVKSVNTLFPDATGNVSLPDVIGLVNPTSIPDGADLNTYTVAGLFFIVANTNVNNRPGTATASATVEVVPQTSNNTGDVIQRVTTPTDSFWRPYTGGIWGSWNQMATVGMSIQAATTTTLGGVIVGSGLVVTPTGVLSTLIQSVNGYSEPFIELTATDVNAMPLTEIGVAGGLAGFLTDDLDPVVFPETGTFFGTRLPDRQLPLRSLTYNGTWNASTNQVTGFIVELEGQDAVQLLANGEMNIHTTVDQGGGAGTVTADVPVPGSGKVFYVTTAGTTNLDGTSNWAVGDVVASLNGQWFKLRDATGYVLPVASATVRGGIRVGANLTIDGNGILSAAAGYTLPNATATVTGGVRIGDGIAISGPTISSPNWSTAGAAKRDLGLGGYRLSNGSTTQMSERHNTTNAMNGFNWNDGPSQRSGVYSGGGGSYPIVIANLSVTDGGFRDLVLEFINAGTVTLTFTDINWVMPDGTTTLSLPAYMAAIGRTSLQSSGSDFMYFWCNNATAGAPIYGKIV